MYCTYCGNKLPEPAVFCPNCGNRVSSARIEGSSNTSDQISVNFQPTSNESRGFRPLFNLAILFGGVIFTDWAVSEVLSVPAKATEELTKMSLDAAIAVAVIGMVFARRWVNWKTTLILTVMLSVGILLLVLSVRNTYRDHLSSLQRSDMTTATEAKPAALSNVGQQQSLVPDLVLDDIAPGDDGAIFENAFVHDPSCEGLTLMHWKTSTEKEREVLLGQRYPPCQHL